MKRRELITTATTAAATCLAMLLAFWPATVDAGDATTPKTPSKIEKPRLNANGLAITVTPVGKNNGNEVVVRATNTTKETKELKAQLQARLRDFNTQPVRGRMMPYERQIPREVLEGRLKPGETKEIRVRVEELRKTGQARLELKVGDQKIPAGTVSKAAPNAKTTDAKNPKVR